MKQLLKNLDELQVDADDMREGINIQEREMIDAMLPTLM